MEDSRVQEELQGMEEEELAEENERERDSTTRTEDGGCRFVSIDERRLERVKSQLMSIEETGWSIRTDLRAETWPKQLRRNEGEASVVCCSMSVSIIRTRLTLLDELRCE